MSPSGDSILTTEDRRRLRADALTASEHRSLDGEVGYRVRLLAAHPDRIDADAVVADTRLLAAAGHNAVVSLVVARLGDHLPASDLP